MQPSHQTANILGGLLHKRKLCRAGDIRKGHLKMFSGMWMTAVGIQDDSYLSLGGCGNRRYLALALWCVTISQSVIACTIATTILLITMGFVSEPTVKGVVTL